MEKPQEQIIFENICMDRCLGDYRNYPLNSVGNICHWLRALGFRDYDRVQIGWRNDIGTVSFWGKTIATYRISDELQMPVFAFDNEHKWLQHQQDTYLAGLSKFDNPYKDYLK